MEQIYQLKEREYTELIKNANANKVLINEKANKLYEEKGTFAIKLKIGIGDYEDTIKIVADGYVSDWDDKFPLKEEDKRKILKFTKRRAEELMEGYFGDIIYDTNKLKQAKNEYKSKKKLLSLLTYTGWFVALAVIGITLYCA
jgi:hypothetical protein